MTSRRRIEAALRAGPPDEPVYRGGIADLLVETESDSGNPPPTTSTPSADGPRVRRRWMQIAAIGTAAAGIAALALIATGPDRSPEPAVTNPTPPSAPTSTEPVAPTLEGRWVGPPDAPSSAPGSTAPWFLVFEGDTVALERQLGGIVTSFVSNVSDLTAGDFRVTLTDQLEGCGPGATGDFAWTRSPDGSTLTISVVDDECASRGAAFGGVWSLIDCPTRGADCLGPLEAGRHASVSFDPFGTAAYGQVAYTTPDAWSSPIDDRARLVLRPADSSEGDGVSLYADVAAPAGACSPEADAAVGADSIADALRATMDDAGATTDKMRTVVGGVDAIVVDISTAATSPCADPMRILAARPGAAIDWSVTAAPSRRLRVVLVDLPGERTMAIVVANDASDEENSTLLDAASTIIDSMELSPTP